MFTEIDRNVKALGEVTSKNVFEQEKRELFFLMRITIISQREIGG